MMPSRTGLKYLGVSLGLFIAGMTAVACGSKEAGKTAGQAAPAPAVGVAEVVQQTVPIYSEYVGQTVADETVEIRARVEGVLQEAAFPDGSAVQKGQRLFRIEKDRYEANLQKATAQLAKADSDVIVARQQVQLVKAQAELAQAEANLAKASQDVARYRPLAAQRAVPQQDLDTAVAAEKVAQAAVGAAKATVRNTELTTDAYVREAEASVQTAKAAVADAELDLSYTTIASPISGMIGRRQVDVGNLVGRGESTLLATVSDSDPIRVQFSISETDYLMLAKRYLESGPSARRGKAPAELILVDGSIHPQRGTLRSIERAVDLQTGTLPVEFDFPNPGQLLRPGIFARIRIVMEERENALLVPQMAVQEIQGAKTVLVVDSANKVVLRTIAAEERSGKSFIVRTGLQPGERVIVEGIQKVRPGMTVAPAARPASNEPSGG
jgi:membrane fusion protein (multidrug efflux system)